MTNIASIHSSGGVVVYTSLTANLVVSIARLGHRVGVIDTGQQQPSLHEYFGFDSTATDSAWNEYLWGNAGQAARARGLDVPAPTVKEGAGEIAVMGRGISLIPFSTNAGEVSDYLRSGHDVEPLKEAIQTIAERLALDYLLIDTHPGTTEETVFSFAICQTLVTVLRPDQADYQGAAVALEIARQLGVPRILLVVNDLSPDFDAAQVHEQAESTFNAVVAGVLPLNPKVRGLGKNLFTRANPDHPWSKEVERIARQLIS